MKSSIFPNHYMVITNKEEWEISQLILFYLGIVWAHDPHSPKPFYSHFSGKFLVINDSGVLYICSSLAKPCRELLYKDLIKI